VFAVLCVMNGVLALGLMRYVGDVTRTGRAQDVAQVLACEARPSDTVYVSGAYPYDLPFYTQAAKAMVVVADWPALRQSAGDGWQRELFEGAVFDAQAAQVLQPPAVLAAAGAKPANWLVTRNEGQAPAGADGWLLFYQGVGWSLFKSGGDLAPKGPEAAENKGLTGCKDQGHK
jgi:hypothetical protein